MPPARKWFHEETGADASAHAHSFRRIPAQRFVRARERASGTSPTDTPYFQSGGQIAMNRAYPPSPPWNFG
jgi:hypothetical protein